MKKYIKQISTQLIENNLNRDLRENLKKSNAHQYVNKFHRENTRGTES